MDRRAARKASTMDRVTECARMVNADDLTGEPWIVWCDSTRRARPSRKAIPGAVEVRGATVDVKAERSHYRSPRLRAGPRDEACIAGLAHYTTAPASPSSAWTWGPTTRLIRRRCWRFGHDPSPCTSSRPWGAGVPCWRNLRREEDARRMGDAPPQRPLRQARSSRGRARDQHLRRKQAHHRPPLAGDRREAWEIHRRRHRPNHHRPLRCTAIASSASRTALSTARTTACFRCRSAALHVQQQCGHWQRPQRRGVLRALRLRDRRELARVMVRGAIDDARCSLPTSKARRVHPASATSAATSSRAFQAQTVFPPVLIWKTVTAMLAHEGPHATADVTRTRACRAGASITSALALRRSRDQRHPHRKPGVPVSPSGRTVPPSPVDGHRPAGHVAVPGAAGTDDDGICPPSTQGDPPRGSSCGATRQVVLCLAGIGQGHIALGGATTRALASTWRFVGSTEAPGTTTTAGTANLSASAAAVVVETSLALRAGVSAVTLRRPAARVPFRALLPPSEAASAILPQTRRRAEGLRLQPVGDRRGHVLDCYRARRDHCVTVCWMGVFRMSDDLTRHFALRVGVRSSARRPDLRHGR